MKSLVAYYSRTNVTKKLAEDIAKKTNADIEEIIPKVNYQGKLGFMRGGKHALSEKIIDIENMKFDPADYDVVYIGSPIWAGKTSAPVISYLKQNEGKFSNVKFFMTAGSPDFEKAFEQMEKFSAKPLKTLGLTTKEVKKDDYILDSFLE
ncbi:flavodoxin [Methanobrevibacter sp.]|uniref:flavodoxin family protein n=1 Tax=Methanobrevibacter sp. TaxID=66852 RepID=UPI0025FA6A96|nr:flavodoxin [Methanobrevibacter sp.]MBR4447952.1 flavodoxin [Methanobrevibacter sp.]